MRITELSLTDFRNYAHLNLKFNKELTILTGENAQGKTNIVESMMMLSVAKSHRTSHDLDMIHWEASSARIKGHISTTQYHFPVELSLSHKGKIAKINDIEQSKLSHFIGKFNTILFSPEDMQLVKGSPSLRRRFIDIELGQSHPVYLNYLVDYQKILKQRNSYLKHYQKTKQFDAIFYDILTEQLVQLAAKIITYRLEFVENLQKIANPIHLDLSQQRDHLTLQYVSGSSRLHYDNIETLELQLLTALKSDLEREKLYGTTQLGPHRDDILFHIGEKKAQLFGSQGQQRSIVLSLKLAEIELIEKITGEYPVLLLDDVLSELDDERQHILMNYIENRVQTILTTATVKGIKLHRLNQAEIFYVKNGHVSITMDDET